LSIDRVDRRAGVRVGGEQHPAGPRVDIHGVLKELDAVHVRHPVVGQDEGDQVAAKLHLAQGVEGGRAGLGPDDPVPVAIPAAQVPGYRPGHARVVVNGDDGSAGYFGGIWHTSILIWPGNPAAAGHVPPGWQVSRAGVGAVSRSW
jgi:hypothetical protein